MFILNKVKSIHSDEQLNTKYTATVTITPWPELVINMSQLFSYLHILTDLSLDNR